MAQENVKVGFDTHSFSRQQDLFLSNLLFALCTLKTPLEMSSLILFSYLKIEVETNVIQPVLGHLSSHIDCYVTMFSHFKIQNSPYKVMFTVKGTACTQ